ncbi:GUN4 domain-containing protein [Microcoleus sp. FACHB-SPT15]|uniref:GUN4 domain-containing protein n=1 Tax=Microcoleus sp. FACHB-SPT15 TaxID=2692830 RepID=UPI00177F1546|nr:GUN4 domain-containing protein [Microcoleus sp. FACHB-SPT15]MBD1806184.1 GUN4 domain-containing protein [Microcoleus sp. FACHB-SPT15]
MFFWFHLPSQWFSARQKFQYYSGLLLAVAASLIALWGLIILFCKPGTWVQPIKIIALSRLTTGVCVMAIGGTLMYSSRYRQRKLKREPIGIENGIDDCNIDDGNSTSTINTRGGNYNESVEGNYIQGDYNYITIQGDRIRISSNFSEVAAQLLKIVIRLQSEGYSKEEAQRLVALNLENQAKDKPSVKEKLCCWNQVIGKTSNESSLFEAATAVVQAATETSLSVPATEIIQAAPVSNTNFLNLLLREPVEYQQLEDLLESGQWQKADIVTASLILKPLSQKIGHNQKLTDHIGKYIKEDFPGENLRSINSLWLRYTEGRFGFSVQKDIWREVNRNYPAFGERVGWYEGGWIYYTDITYSLKAPSGHLPILVLIAPYLHRSRKCVSASKALRLFALRQYTMY